MIATLVLLLAGLQLKHFVADYLLQTRWMIAGKGSLRLPGGYAHAGIHALCSMLVLAVFGTPMPVLLAVPAAEFAVHYLLDYAKAHYGRDVQAASRPKLFWALHGLDQLLHQATYLAMAWVVAVALFPS